jgi:hypothetical protein
MEGHAPFPDRENLEGVAEVIGKFVKEDVAETPPENHSQGPLEDQVGNIILRER